MQCLVLFIGLRSKKLNFYEWTNSPSVLLPDHIPDAIHMNIPVMNRAALPGEKYIYNL